MVQPLLLLKQTLESVGDPGPLLLEGPNVRFTKADQILHQRLGSEPSREFACRIELTKSGSLELVFCQKAGIDLCRMVYREGSQTVTFEKDMTHDEIVRNLPKGLDGLYRGHDKDLKWRMRRNQCFLAVELEATAAQKAPFLVPGGVSPSVLFEPHITGLIHVPGLRGNPERTYQRTGAGPRFPGTFESYVASLIYQWQQNGGREKRELLARWVGDLGLTWKVEALPVDDTKVELRVGRLLHARRGGGKDLVNIADVGFGVSQSLPVLVALAAAHPGQLVYLEQPEIHLHPLAQRKLASVLRDASKRGAIAIVETHSILLVRQVLTLVAKGELKREDVALHWFQRDAEGQTTVHIADLDDAGRYGAWPQDFDQTELDAETEYLDAVEKFGA